jgi:sugar lactone lactonase YvrE
MNGLRLCRCALGVMAAAALVAGCGGQSQVAPTGATIGAASASRAVLRASTKDPWLYVSGNENNTVAIYDLAKSGFPEVGTLTNGVSGPEGIDVDKQGQVYVANWTGTVTIYPPGESSPSLTLSDELSEPDSVTVDKNENVWVCNRGSSPSIVVFPPGQPTPSAVITNSLIQSPTQIQFDADGDLYYTDSSTGVSEIPNGSQNMTSLGLDGLQRTDGIAIDSTGNLFVGTFGSELDGVRVYVPDYQKPIRTLKDAKGSDYYASGVVRKTEYAFIPDSYDDTVKAFTSRGREPDFVINAGAAQYAVGVAVKAAGVP